MNEKMIDIETMLAHHEEQITQMSDLIASQWAQIEMLKKQVRLLSNRLEQGQSDTSDGGTPLSTLEQAAQDKPPHY